MGYEVGTVINKTQVTDKISGPVKASVNLGIGWVYEDAGNGWTNAPTDGSIPAKQLYWNPKALDNSAGAKGDKVGTFYGDEALVIGKADGAIAVDDPIKTSANVARSCQSLTIRVDTIGNYSTDKKAEVGQYIGHVTEYTGVKATVDRTNAADLETNCVFLIRRVMS